MSPEQAGVISDAVDHRADLYSLGATLYELLTLRPVFDGQDRRTLLRQIAMDEPTSPRRIDPTIPRDLETIVLKALAKEPRDRYADAASLAEDFRRYLADLSIRARRPNPAERLARWGRRHRPLVATALISLVTCLSVGMAILWGEHAATLEALDSKAKALGEREVALREAERARGEASEALRLSYGLMQSVTVSAMGELAVNDLISPEIYTTAIDYFDHLSQIDTTDPELMGMSADAARWAGYLGAAQQFLLVRRNLAEKGWDPKIAEDYHRAIELNELLINEWGDAKYIQNLATALESYAWWLSWADPSRKAEVEATQVRSLNLWRDLALGRSMIPDAQRKWIEAMTKMEDRFLGEGRIEEAIALRSDCLASLAKMADSRPASRSMAAHGYRQLGNHALSRGQHSRGFDLLRTAIEINPEAPAVLNDLAWALVNAEDRTPEQLEEAFDLAKRAVAMAPKTGALQNTLAVVLYRKGDLNAAEVAVRESIRLYQGEAAIDHFLLAMIHHDQGKFEDAKQQYDHGIELIELRGLGMADRETIRFRDEATTHLELKPQPERP